MNYRSLGRTGLMVSELGFGCGSTGGLFVRGNPKEQRAAVARALECGVNYFDTAVQYGEGQSEQHLGSALAEFNEAPYVGTKLRIRDHEIADARHVLRSQLEASLRRLQRDHVDICSLHSRVGGAVGALDPASVCGPVADAMEALVDGGLARAIGFSGLGDTVALHCVVESGRFDAFQCYFNLLNQSAAIPGSPDGSAQDFEGILRRASEREMGAIGIRVLAGGALSDVDARHPVAGPIGAPMAQGETYERDRERAMSYLGRLDQFDVESLPELAYRFALSNPHLSTVLGGFSDLNQLETALTFIARGPLPGETLRSLTTSTAP